MQWVLVSELSLTDIQTPFVWEDTWSMMVPSFRKVSLSDKGMEFKTNV